MDNEEQNGERALLEALGELDAAGREALDAAAAADAGLAKERKELAEVAGQLRIAAEYMRLKDAPVPDEAIAKMRAAWRGEDGTEMEEKVVAFLSGRWRGVLLAAAACLAAVLVAVVMLKGEGGIAVTGPVGEIAEGTPVLEWENDADPAKKYDVWILPAEGDHLEVPMLFVAKGVRSPLAFSDLKPGPAAPSPDADALEDGDYRLLVCHADMGRMSGTPVKFSVKRKKEE